MLGLGLGYLSIAAWAMRSMLPLRAASLGASFSTPVVAGEGPVRLGLGLGLGLGVLLALITLSPWLPETGLSK